MLRKSLIVVAAVAAMALPAAALGDDGTPAKDPGAKFAQIQAKLQSLKQKCDSKPEAAAKCAKIAQRVLDGLDKASARIDERVTKIKDKCSGANPPEKCSKAPELLQKLDAAKQAIAQLEAWIKANFSSAPASAPAPAPAP